jgi:hypothetical protein
VRGAAVEIVHGAGIAGEIGVAVDVRGVVVDAVAGAVDGRAAAVEIVGVAGVLEAGAAEEDTKVRCDNFVATDFHGSIRIHQRELYQKS